MLILADTGVLLRLMEPTDPLHLIVRKAVRVLTGRGEGMVTALQNAAEFWNVCTRPKTARGGLGLSLPETDRRLRVLERSFDLPDEIPAPYPIWRRLVVAHAVRGKQVHDARLAAIMLAQGVTHILTLNGADFTRYPGIVVLDPALVTP